MTWFCFSEKIVCGHPFHYLLIKMFWSLCTNFSENLFNFIFNLIFYVALWKSLSIYNVPAVFFIKRVLTNFAKSTEKTYVSGFLFNSAAEIQPATKKKRLRQRCFPVSKFLRTFTLQNTSGRLSLSFVSEILVKKAFSMILQYFRNSSCKLSKSFGCSNCYHHIVIKSMDWFLYDNGLRHERVKNINFLAKTKRCLYAEFCEFETN